MSPEQRSIPVTVDKSHLITIGEKLYTEKTSFIRELVNNAYDADATAVDIIIDAAHICVRDNGTGMDEAGLRQYFTIGGSEKRTESVSARFGRKRIGEFGIGKFAALAACRRFEIETQRGDFRARLLFDKEAWSRHEDWHLNIDVLPKDESGGDGTTITLHDLTTAFIPGKVRRYLAEHAPIHAPEFAIMLNGERVTDEIVSGRKVPIALTTSCGPITGYIIIVPDNRRIENLGIVVAVKGVRVRAETFGLDTMRKLGASRITGRVNADWLPVTSSRDDFLRDTTEYGIFVEAIKKELQKILGTIRREADKQADLQASRILKDALSRIGRAMRRRHELFPGVIVPLGSTDQTANQAGYEISQAEFVNTHEDLDPALAGRLSDQQKKKRARGRPSGILGARSVIRTFKVGNLDIALRLEHLGEEEDESVLSGGIIYVNLDHPLYRTYRNADELLTLHVARVITKELALQTGMTDAAAAFALQSELLTDALKGKGI